MLPRNLAGELDFLKDLALALADRDPDDARFRRRQPAPRASSNSPRRCRSTAPMSNVEGPATRRTRVIVAAVEAAKAAREVEDEAAIDFIAPAADASISRDPETQAAALVFAARFQQTTGPVMAKALEDTVFYRYNRLIALNEVGGEPDRFGAPRRGVPSRHAGAPREQPLGLSRHRDARHQARRGRSRPPLCASARCRRPGARRCGAGAPCSRRASCSGRRRRRARAGDRMAVLPGAGRRLAGRSRARRPGRRSTRLPSACRPTW